MRRETTVTRLGAGVDRRRRLDAAAAERTRVCLSSYATHIAGFGPDVGLLAATSVLRDAADGAGFLAGAAALVGLPARVLSGEEEAALSFAGAMAGCEPVLVPPRVAADGATTLALGATSALVCGAPATVVIDIGGGSLELAVGTREAAGRPRPFVRLQPRHRRRTADRALLCGRSA